MNGGTGTVKAGLDSDLLSGMPVAAPACPVLDRGEELWPGTGRAWPLFSGLGPVGALPTAPRLARAFSTLILKSWHLAALEDTAALIVSELSTNVVRAAQDREGNPVYGSDGRLPVMWLRLMADRALLGIEVWDSLPVTAGAPALRRADPAADSGRGLAIVASLSLKWGWERVPGGQEKRTWAVLAIE